MFLPSRQYPVSVEIENQTGYDEENSHREVGAEVGIIHAASEDLRRIIGNHLTCDEHRGDHPQTPVDDFFRPHSNQQQRFGLDQPDTDSRAPE